MKIRNWLNKPYPFIERLSSKLLISFLFGLFVYLFLAFFQPFRISEITINIYTYLLGFGFITTFVLFISYILLPLIFSKLFDSNLWNVKKEIIFYLSNIIIIAILNYEYDLISNYVPTHQFSRLLSFLWITPSVGIFPLLFLVFIREIYLTGKSKKNALELNSRIVQRNKTLTKSEVITINANTKSDKFKLNLRDLLYVKSEDNYCQLYFRENDKIQNRLLRVSLKNIEEQLKAYPEILRCHRSYIVNKNHIAKVSGNARSYAIHFALCDQTVSVSRYFPKEKLI